MKGGVRRVIDELWKTVTPVTAEGSKCDPVVVGDTPSRWESYMCNLSGYEIRYLLAQPTD